MIQGGALFEDRLKLMHLNRRISLSVVSEEMAHKFAPDHCLECHVFEPESECDLVETAENSISFSLEEMFHF